MSKKALGKGLDALIQPEESAPRPENGVGEVAIGLLDSTDEQPRKKFSEDTLAELAASIKENGVIQPIIVEKTDNRYRIVAGERRYRAAKLAGLDKIPVIVRNYDVADRLQVALIENIQRENLNPIEEAAAYERLIKQLELKQDELAARIGKSRSTIANALRLLKLPAAMQEALVAGKLTPGHARAILAVINPMDRESLFSEIVEGELSVREAEELSEKLNSGVRSGVRSGAGKAKPVQQKKAAKKTAEFREIEQRLLESLGTKVQLKGSISAGRIEVSYFSQEELERLIDLLGGGG